MTTKKKLDNMVPVLRYECPVCNESFATGRECLDHIRNHDEMVMTLYLDREENGEFTFDMGSARPVPPDWARKHSKPVKSTCWKDRWYVEVPDNPGSIAQAKRQLVQAALEWYRAGLSQLEALESNHKQNESQDDHS